MGCEQIREILSAHLDGEAGPEETARAQAHLDGCAACRQWLDGAAAVTRLARLAVQPPMTGMPDVRLDAAPGRIRARVVAVLRVLLAVLGAMQILLGVAQAAMPAMAGMAMSGHAEGATADHLLHETAAWNLAVGAGFLFIAARRTRPTGVLPILTAFVAALSLLSVDDMLSGAVAWSRLASHTLLLAGYAIVVVLARPGRRREDPPAGRTRSGARRWPLGRAADNVVPLRRGLPGQSTVHSGHRAA
jgi:predicted anti-sigma-YlaC factor YlaD